MYRAGSSLYQPVSHSVSQSNCMRKNKIPQLYFSFSPCISLSWLGLARSRAHLNDGQQKNGQIADGPNKLTDENLPGNMCGGKPCNL